MPEVYPERQVSDNRSVRNLLLGEFSLVVLPSLACVVGLNKAIIIQQIHYWIQHKQDHSKKHADGFRLGH